MESLGIVSRRSASKPIFGKEASKAFKLFQEGLKMGSKLTSARERYDGKE